MPLFIFPCLFPGKGYSFIAVLLKNVITWAVVDCVYVALLEHSSIGRWWIFLNEWVAVNKFYHGKCRAGDYRRLHIHEKNCRLSIWNQWSGGFGLKYHFVFTLINGVPLLVRNLVSLISTLHVSITVTSQSSST